MTGGLIILNRLCYFDTLDIRFQPLGPINRNIVLQVGDWDFEAGVRHEAVLLFHEGPALSFQVRREDKVHGARGREREMATANPAVSRCSGWGDCITSYRNGQSVWR